MPCRCRLSKPNNNDNFLKQHEFPHSDKLTLKGVSKRSKNQFTFENYLFRLQNQRPERISDYRILSKSQQISSNIVRKIALSGFMDKRYVLDCGIHTVPFHLISIVNVLNLNAYKIFLLLIVNIWCDVNMYRK